MNREAKISADIHVRDEPFVCVRRTDTLSGPYYVLRAGAVTLFLDPARIADLLTAVQPHADAAAHDVSRLRAEAEAKSARAAA